MTGTNFATREEAEASSDRHGARGGSPGKPRFGYTVVAASALGERSQSGISPEYGAALQTLGGEVWDMFDVADPAPLLVFVETGGTERTIMDVWRRRLDTAPSSPILLVAHPGNNSLPAALEALARLQQDGLKGRVLFLRGPDDADGLARVGEAVRDVDVRRQLFNARIGVVGSPSGWLVASSPDPTIVRAAWGPQIVPVSLDQLTEAIRSAASEGASSRSESIESEASEVREPSPGDVTSAELVYAAVRHIADQYNFGAVALRCFDLIEQMGTTGCVALSKLADDGVVAGCEGDVVSSVAMLWVRLLLGETAWMANPACVDVEGGSLTLAHCTVPRTMVDGYGLRSHFESGLGVAIQGVLPEGPVTLLRIGGADMRDLWLAEGEVTGAGTAEDRCRTQADVRLVDGGDVSGLLKRPLGNHVVLVRGHHGARLRAWWQTVVAQ